MAGGAGDNDSAGGGSDSPGWKPGRVRGQHHDSCTEAHAHLKELLDAAERGRLATVPRAQDVAEVPAHPVDLTEHHLVLAGKRPCGVADRMTRCRNYVVMTLSR